MSTRSTPDANNRREFLKAAGVLAVATACSPSTVADRDGGKSLPANSPSRPVSFSSSSDVSLLRAVGDTVLPESLGAASRAQVVADFVAWCDGYDPVAEEMHGYGYADVRYLPPDPVPAWQAQLRGLNVLAERMHHHPFAKLGMPERMQVIASATRRVRGERLPSPLAADHVVVALLAYWSSTPDAWNRALGVTVSPTTCRPLAGVDKKPLPIVSAT